MVKQAQLVLALFVSLTTIASSLGGLTPSNWLLQILKKQMLAKLEANVNAIVSVSVNTSTADGNKTIYLWDILPTAERFLMLNQTQVQMMKWNVSERVIANKTRLEWASLPAGAKFLLLKQNSDLAFFNLTYLQWAWVDTRSIFAQFTLLSLVPKEYLEFYPDILKIFNKLPFNMVLDAKKLCAPETNTVKCLHEKSQASISLINSLKNTAAQSYHQPNSNVSAISILNDAEKRASVFLSRYLANN